MSGRRSLLTNVASGWVGLAVSLATTLIVTPVVVHALDRELYGLWSWLNGLLMYTDLLYFGLGSAVIKTVAHLRTREDLPAIGRLISVVASIYGTLGVICFATFIWIGHAFPSLLAEPLSPGASRQAFVTCVILGGQLLMVFTGSAFSGLMAGYNRFDLINAVSVLSTLLRGGAILVTVRPGDHALQQLAIVSAATEVLRTILLVAIGSRLTRGIRIRPIRPRRSELQHLYGFGLQSFFVMFAVRIISSTDTTVIGVVLGASSVALYTLPLQLLEQMRSSVSSVSGVLLPSVTALATDGSSAAVREFYLSTTRITCFLAGGLAGTAIAIGPAFLSRWVGEQFGASAQWVLVYLAFTMFFQNLSIHSPLAFYQAFHLLRRPSLVLVAEAVANLSLSIWLARRIGVTGVALATVIPAVFVSTAILPHYLCRQLQVPIRRLVIEAVGPGLLLLAMTVALQWSAGLLIDSGTYIGIGLRALTSVPAAYLIFRLMFPEEEQALVWRALGFRSSP